MATAGKEHSCTTMRATTQRAFIDISVLTSANPPFAPPQATVAAQDPQVALAVPWGTLTRAQGPHQPTRNMGKGMYVKSTKAPS